MTDNILLELKHPTDATASPIYIVLPTSECSKVLSTYNALSDAEKRAGLSVNKASLAADEHWEVDSTCEVKTGTTTPTPTPTPETAMLRLVSEDIYQIDIGTADTTPTPTPTLGALMGLYAAGFTDHEVRLVWQYPANANRLAIWRRTDPSAAWQVVTASTPGSAGLGAASGSIVYIDNTLSPNTRYYYQVQPLNSDTGAFGSRVDVSGPNGDEIRTTS